MHSVKLTPDKKYIVKRMKAQPIFNSSEPKTKKWNGVVRLKYIKLIPDIMKNLKGIRANQELWLQKLNI